MSNTQIARAKNWILLGLATDINNAVREILPMHPRRDPGAACDFNDLAAMAGLDAVRACFAEAGVLQ
jgi:hypothetical protein